jgi:hypothetical protein
MLNDLGGFVLAAVHRWGVLATGGLIVGAIAVYEHLSSKSITGWPLWVVIFLSIFVAVFSAWRDQCDYTMSFKNQLEELTKLKLLIDSPESQVAIQVCGSGPRGKIFVLAPNLRYSLKITMILYVLFAILVFCCIKDTNLEKSKR